MTRTPMTWCWRCGSKEVVESTPTPTGLILWCTDCVEWAERCKYAEMTGRPVPPVIEKPSEEH